MDPYYHALKRNDSQLLMITHLSQLLTYCTGFGGLVAPLLLWLTQKDKVVGMDVHGKSILNFQLSIILYSLLCVPLILVFGLGLLGLIIIGIFAFVMPIVNALRASSGNDPSYPFTLNFIS